MGKQTVLVVDDEQHIIDLARMYLEQEGFTVEQALDGAEALRKIRDLKPALVVLDLMLPEVDGWEVCRRARESSDVPIIMLTARSDDVDKIVGLELGADDYLTKPFNPRELVARVKAILRRYDRSKQPGAVIHLGQLTIDPSSREVTLAALSLELRTQEFELLYTPWLSTGVRSLRANSCWTWHGATISTVRRARWMSTSPTCARSCEVATWKSRLCAVWDTSCQPRCRCQLPCVRDSSGPT